MIYIKFEKGQGLGNQLWLYAAAISISKKLKCQVHIINYSEFVGKKFIILKRSRKKNKKIKFIFKERFYYDAKIKHVSHFYDNRFTSIKKNTLLVGYFQDERYFLSQNIQFNALIKLKRKRIIRFNNNTCVLNIRGGEYKRHKNLILPRKYWINSIKKMRIKKVKKFIIVTDDKRYAKKLFPRYGIISDSVKLCFEYLMYCKNIVVSNSSFSYFPIKIGEKKKNIIAPAYWSRHTNKLGIWASPSNYYHEWKWLNNKGKFIDNVDIENNIKNLEKYYQTNFTLLSDFNNLDQIGLRKYIPKKIRIISKKFLSLLFPLKYG